MCSTTCFSCGASPCCWPAPSPSSTAWPGLAIRLDGHTDNTGDDKDPKPNQELSEQRVAAVKAYLVKHGVAESRLSTQGYGGSRPVAPNDTEAHKAQNRRVEFVILKR